MSAAFTDHRQAALALLSGGHRMSMSAGQFLGQIIVLPKPLSEKQYAWLSTLLEKHGLPPLADHHASDAPIDAEPCRH